MIVDEEDRKQHLRELRDRSIIEDLAQGWVQVKGPDGETLPYPYEVNVAGEVRRREGPGKVRNLEPYPSGGGERYLKVDLRAEGLDRRQVYVHQLVAWSHLPGDGVGQVVDHINGDPTDNRAVNLRYKDPRDEEKVPQG